MKIGRRFICGLVCGTVIVVLATRFQADPAQSNRPARYCPADDPYVSVHAEINSLELAQHEESEIGFRAHVTVSISNISAESVFVLSGRGSNFLEGTPEYGAVALARTREDALSCRYIQKSGAYPGIDRSAYWQELSRELDHQTPSASVIRTIAPGGKWEFKRVIHFGMWKYDIDHGKAMSDILSDPHVWLRVELLMWSNNLEWYTRDFGANLGRRWYPRKFGASLQERWEGSGHLIIEKLWTEPVEVTLPLK